MSALYRKNHGYLHILCHASPHQRQFLLNTATPEQVHAICEVCYNLLRENIPSSSALRLRLGDFKHELIDLANESVPFKEKKKILSQTGGGFIEDALMPLLSGLGMILL